MGTRKIFLGRMWFAVVGMFLAMFNVGRLPAGKFFSNL